MMCWRSRDSSRVLFEGELRSVLPSLRLLEFLMRGSFSAFLRVEEDPITCFPKIFLVYAAFRRSREEDWLTVSAGWWGPL